MHPITASHFFCRRRVCGSLIHPIIGHYLWPHGPSAHYIVRVHYNSNGSANQGPPVLHGEIEYPADSTLQATLASLRRSLARIEASTSHLQSEYTSLSTRKAVSDLENNTKEAQLALFLIKKEISVIYRQKDALEKEKIRDAFDNSVDKQARLTMKLVTWFFIASLGIMFIDELIELFEILSGKAPEKRRARRVVIEPDDHRGDHNSDLWRWFLEE